MSISTKQKIRFIIRWSIALSSYCLTIRFLFHDHELILSLISVFVFFISFHFFYLEVYKFKWQFILISLILWTAISGFIMTPQTIIMRIANIWFHITIGLLAISLNQQTEKSIWFNGFAYFFVWWYLFTMALSLVYSTVIVNFFSEFPIDCKWLSQQSDKIITTITRPFKISREKTQEITESTKTALSSTFWDVFKKNKNIEIFIPKENNILNKIKTRKDNFINETIIENERLNNTICDYTLQVINEKLKSPTIQYPVILFILFLIYPFLRIIVWIISIVWLLLFEVLYLFNIYTKHKETKEVDRIW